MSGEMELYYFPWSYFSMKVIYALYEKKVPFKGHTVDIHSGEQSSEWYLKINPNGEVPCLKDGDTIVIESEDILNYIDKKFPDVEPRLVPDETSELGQQVIAMRKLLNSICIDHITYGLMANHQFCVDVATPRFPWYFRRWLTKKNIQMYFENAIKKIKADIETRPDVRDNLKRKLALTSARGEAALDVAVVSDLLDDLEPVFDKIEAQLIKSGAAADKENKDIWLLGQRFTAADIIMAVLTTRMYDLGADGRFFSPTKRPVVFDYYKRLMARSSSKKVNALKLTSGNVYLRTSMRRFIRTVAPYSFAAGLIAGAAFVYYRYIR